MRTLLAGLGLLGVLLTTIPADGYGGTSQARQVGWGLLVWETATGAEDREWGTLLAVAIDGGASLTPPGHEGEGHKPSDRSGRGREDS
jgi:hypothetical protein